MDSHINGSSISWSDIYNLVNYCTHITETAGKEAKPGDPGAGRLAHKNLGSWEVAKTSLLQGKISCKKRTTT